MGERTVRFSDLSNQQVEAEQLASLTVEHPDYELPLRLEATPEELEPLKKLGIRAVRLEVQLPGEDQEPSRYIVPEKDFDKLATGRKMAEVLAEAEQVAVTPTRTNRRSHNKTANGEPLRTFNTLGNAGLPHMGKVSAEEARLVRENLEAVNANRAAQGHAPIDPANPIDAKRYGFDQPAPSGA
jgi:hypothetical protein